MLTEGRGSNAGTCFVNLKDWQKRDKSINEIIEELEEKTKILVQLLNILNHLRCLDIQLLAILFGLIDKNNSDDYKSF